MAIRNASIACSVVITFGYRDFAGNEKIESPIPNINPRAGPQCIRLLVELIQQFREIAGLRVALLEVVGELTRLLNDRLLDLGLGHFDRGLDRRHGHVGDVDIDRVGDRELVGREVVGLGLPLALLAGAPVEDEVPLERLRLGVSNRSLRVDRRRARTVRRTPFERCRVRPDARDDPGHTGGCTPSPQLQMAR